ncbi:unnamed protein product, partial [Symbiodinium sp. CCMP2592]
IGDDGFLTVAKTRRGRPLDQEDPPPPPKACQDDYTAVDMLEFHLYMARKKGGQKAVDDLCMEMARER